MIMEIKKTNTKNIKKSYKIWFSIWLVSLFFMALSFASILLSPAFIGFIILLGTTPVIIIFLVSNQEMNYNKIMLEIRNKNNEE